LSNQEELHMNTAIDTQQHDEPAFYLPVLDIYGLIHKGLRFAFGDLVTRLGRLEPQDDLRLREVLGDLEQLLLVLHSHAHHEEEHLHRAIDARLPGGAERLRGDHLNQEREMDALRNLARACQSSSGRARVAALRALYLAFATFAGENLVHMCVEESYAQPLLEQLYSTAELGAIQGALLQSISPEDTVRAMQFMAAGVDHAERVGMFEGFKVAAPRWLYDDFVRAALPRLDDAARRALLERIPSLRDGSGLPA
jgi:hypothetical protein